MAFLMAAGVAAALVAPAEVAPPARPGLEALLARLDKVASKYQRRLSGYTVTQECDDYRSFSVRTVDQVRAITSD